MLTESYSAGVNSDETKAKLCIAGNKMLTFFGYTYVYMCMSLCVFMCLIVCLHDCACAIIFYLYKFMMEKCKSNIGEKENEPA